METFREARIDDAKSLAVVRQKAWDATYRGIYSDEMIDSFDYDLHEQRFIQQINNPQIKVYIIERDNKAIGYLTFGEIQSGCYKDFLLCLHSLYVLPEYQRSGIGTRAFDIVKGYCLRKGINKFYNSCNYYNEKAKVFYKKMGGVIAFEDLGNIEKAGDQGYIEYNLIPYYEEAE